MRSKSGNYKADMRVASATHCQIRDATQQTRIVKRFDTKNLFHRHSCARITNARHPACSA